MSYELQNSRWVAIRTSRANTVLRAALPVFAFVFCAARYISIVRDYAVNVFLGDHWVYNEPTLFHRRAAWEIFRWQSPPWRQGLGGLLSLWVGTLTHWNNRDESFMCAALVIAAAALALYLKIRTVGPLTAWDVIIPAFALSPTGYQTIVGVTHYSHGPLPFLLVISFCLAWTIQRPKLKYGAITILAFLCAYTGFAVFAALLCPVLIAVDLWIQRREMDAIERKTAAFAFAASIAILLSFFYGFKTSDGVCGRGFSDPATGAALRWPNPFHYLLFVAFMFANFAGLKAPLALVPSILAGLLLSGAVFAALGVALYRRPFQIVPVILISYSLVFALATAHGRMCLGLSAALGSRYMIYLVPAFIGVYLLAVTGTGMIAPRITLAGLAIVALATSLTHPLDLQDMVELRRIRSDWKQCYLSEHNLIDCNRKTGATVLSYPDTIQPKVDFLEQHRLNLFYREE